LSREFERAVEKLEDAQLFLNELAGTWDDRRARAFFSAFLNAARSVTFVLQACLKHVPGFEAWWSAQQESMRGDALARFFHLARNESEKLGVRPMHYRGVSTRLGPGGEPRCRRLYRFRPLEDGKVPVPQGDAVTTCQRHLKMLARILREAAARFVPEVGEDSSLASRIHGLAEATLPPVGVCPLHAGRHRGAGPIAQVPRRARPRTSKRRGRSTRDR
jgi:hypothetical protein